MRRAAVSIIANIAEGYGKKHLTGYIHFISIAICSCNELGVYIKLSKDLQYLKLDDFQIMNIRHNEILKMLLALRSSLENKSNPDP